MKKYVYTSSTITLTDNFPGEEGVILNENSWAKEPEKMDTYAASKYYGEKAVWRVHEGNKDKIDIVSILPTTIFGPFAAKTSLVTPLVVLDAVTGTLPGYLA